MPKVALVANKRKAHMNVSFLLPELAQRAFSKLAALALLTSAMTAAQAAYLVDTGTPPNSSYYTGLGYYSMDMYGYEYTTQQHLATSFNIVNDSTITSLGAYLYNNGSGSVTYELHEGGPNGILLYRGNVSSVGAADYYTLSGLNLAVDAGLYTLNLIAGYGFDGGLPTGAPGKPDTLTAAYWSNDGISWNQDGGDFSYGIRVEGTPVAVPEIDGALLPQALTLMAGSMLLLRRRIC